MKQMRSLVAALVTGVVVLGGCDNDHMSTSGTDPSNQDAATHQTGAGIGSPSQHGWDDPAVNSAAPSATGRPVTGGTGSPMIGGGASGTGSQVSGSSTPPAAAGSAGH